MGVGNSHAWGRIGGEKGDPEPLLVRFHLHFLGVGRRRGPWAAGRGGWGATRSCANSRQGCEPGSGPETVRPWRAARAQTSFQPFPHRHGRDSCARPAPRSAQACFFPFFPAHGNAAACVSFGARLSLAFGGGGFLPGLAFGAWMR